MKTNLRELYGLKYNPFSPDVPTEALNPAARVRDFCRRIEHSLAPEGGFAMISGPPGVGKSVALRLLQFLAPIGRSMSASLRRRCRVGSRIAELDLAAGSTESWRILRGQLG